MTSGRCIRHSTFYIRHMRLSCLARGTIGNAAGPSPTPEGRQIIDGVGTGKPEKLSALSSQISAFSLSARCPGCQSSVVSRQLSVISLL